VATKFLTGIAVLAFMVGTALIAWTAEIVFTGSTVGPDKITATCPVGAQGVYQGDTGSGTFTFTCGAIPLKIVPTAQAN
jgi:hypothetical protein